MMYMWLLLLVSSVVANEIQYMGAVLEYVPYSSWEAGGATILQENARIFLEYANYASQQGADILVFPEYGLTSTNIKGGDMLTLAQVVPPPGDMVVPCSLNHTNQHTKVLGELSCGAAALRIYLVLDLVELAYCNPEEPFDCPDVGYSLFNAQVVLDRCGAVVARYRKKHLFLEPEFTAGKEDDSTAIFTTDFGVTFSLQICFDIMFESPTVTNVKRGVRDVAMSTAWIDELPFLTAPQIFRGWSAGLGVNLLVSNYHNTADGMLGSGIFPNVRGQECSYVYDHHGGTTLLVTSLTTVTSTNHFMPEPKSDLSVSQEQQDGTRPSLNPEDMVFIHENLTRYSHLVLEREYTEYPVTASLCHNDSLCCSVTYTMRNTSTTGSYMLLAYSGPVEKGGGVYSIYIQVCSVVFCLSDDVKSCAHIESEDVPLVSSFLLREIRGVFKAPVVFPSLLRQNLTLVEEQLWSYDSFVLSDGKLEALILVRSDVGPLLSVTLMGRWYQRGNT